MRSSLMIWPDANLMIKRGKNVKVTFYSSLVCNSWIHFWVIINLSPVESSLIDISSFGHFVPTGNLNCDWNTLFWLFKDSDTFKTKTWFRINDKYDFFTFSWPTTSWSLMLIKYRLTYVIITFFFVFTWHRVSFVERVKLDS